jgi:glutamate--cysteine ligase
MTSTASDDDRPVTREELTRLFVEAEKPASEFLIGGEAEKFGVDSKTGIPLCYEGPRGVARIMEHLAEHHGWERYTETEGGPLIALTRSNASITLEPGAQFELSGAPHPDVHGVVTEMRAHMHELESISEQLNVTWLGVGFHPLAAQDALPWVPKHRYGVMKRYLPTRGTRALDMMRRTATVQANYDYSSEADAMQKLVVLLKLSPIIHAMTANSPFIEGQVSTRRSERGDVWLNMDPSRSGLVPTLWDHPKPSYSVYVEWALDAGMFLFRRGDEFILNTGQTFRSFLSDGYQGHRATAADWQLHINTLFPEVRLKRTLEVRGCDMLPMDLIGAVPALATGIIYDAEALDKATELTQRLRLEDVQSARPALVTRGLAASIGDTSARDLALAVLDIADGGLARRARFSTSGEGGDERIHLTHLRALVTEGHCPADVVVRGLQAGDTLPVADIIARCHI